MILYVAGDVGIDELHSLSSSEIAFHFAVETVSHEFKHDVGIAVDAWALALASKLFEDLVDVGHVEITTQTEVLCLPVVAPQEWVDI